MNKKIIPVKATYTTSLEKWKSIRRFAELNGLDTSKIDAMISRIEERGDATLDEPATFEINNISEFIDSVFSGFSHPCPHCTIYECDDCPLDEDESPACCKAWDAVRKEMMSLKMR